MQRHGKAVEPFLVVGESPDSVKVFTPEGEVKQAENEKSKEPKKPEQEAKSAKEVSSNSASGQLLEETQAAMVIPGDTNSPVLLGKQEAKDQPTPLQQAAANTANPLALLETVLQMPPPKTQEEENTEKPPHLQTPPYVHHFDTYTLVQQVEAGGFSPHQSIITMKAVRALLAANMDIAKRGLVSKSDVENVS